ncbi:hypothetical protein EZJ43_01995 [Pedobacter changchengzhani]|uniref:Glutaminyl-tRNA synthetase n=1 Tax=Pedobacter changchengzhani TaxID=2529274 RepID=A0A4R5MQE7_9SPHI|nr:DUF6370 family protein [Pedobacter changchengzhani]TDG37886.1 hypothetical protein EZJ43_01995 [Pedobacter changchengzhani]
MKNLIFALFITVLSVSANAQTTAKKAIEGKKITNQIVDIACGECQFKISQKDAKGKVKKGCDLAVKIDGTAYFVDGKKIDDFGDAHDEHGFCNAVSKAEVTGEIVNNRFKATEIKLLPAKK